MSEREKRITKEKDKKRKGANYHSQIPIVKLDMSYNNLEKKVGRKDLLKNS